MRKVILAAVLSIAGIAFSSCEKTPLDNAKPIINLIAPAEGEAIKPGTDIHFDAVLTDADLIDFDDSPIPGTPWKPADILADVDLTTIR